MFNVTKQRLTALVPATILLFSLGAAPALLAQAKAPDNSGTNKTQNQPVTADQQKNDVSDRDLTAKIRRSVIADKSLSMYAHNVKIIVVAGAVTLKGPVRSDAEKQTIEKKATDIVGAGKVTNDITVKQ
jgi:hyperosmotically inducible protein